MFVLALLLHAVKHICSASLSSDFSLSSSQEASTAALPSAAWNITRPIQIVATTPWTAYAANCRPFSGAVTESPIQHSRSPNSPPTITTARRVTSGTTWKASWRKEPSTEMRGRGGRVEGWVLLQLPRGATRVPPSLCPHLPPLHAIPPRQLTTHTLSLAL